MAKFIDYGLTPDTREELEEIRRGQATFEHYFSGDWEQEHGPYPQRKYKVPPDISWASFEPELRRRKEHFDKLRNNGWCLWWWEIARAHGLPMKQVLWSNQANQTSCAGLSAAMAWSRKTIYQRLTAPVKWELLNPMAMWAITKNYSTHGGQSMAAVKLGAAKYGNYAVTDPGIGEYPGRVSRDLYEKAAPQAQQRQLCSCSMPNTVAAVKLALDALEIVAIGNQRAWRICRLDRNNILIAVPAGGWAHAWNYDAIRYVHGVPYYHADNSWGEIYNGSKENEPAIGCWHTEETVAMMLQGASCWCSVYAETFSDLAVGTTAFVPQFVPWPDYVLHQHS